MTGRTPSERWQLATHAAFFIWLLLMLRLMIADVWGETNGMLAFGSSATSLQAKLTLALTQSLGFWRPLPTAASAVILHGVPDPDLSWRILRAINIAMIAATVHLLRQASGPMAPLVSC